MIYKWSKLTNPFPFFRISLSFTAAGKTLFLGSPSGTAGEAFPDSPHQENIKVRGDKRL